MAGARKRFSDYLILLSLSLRLQLGKRFWIIPLFALGKNPVESITQLANDIIAR